MISDDVAAAVLDSLPTPVALLGPDGSVVRLSEAWRRSAATGVALLPVRPGMSWLAACDHAAADAAALATAPATGDSLRSNSADAAGPDTPGLPLSGPGGHGLGDHGRGTDPAAPLRTLALLSRQMIDRRRTRARLELPHPGPGGRWLDVRFRALVRGDGVIVIVDDVTDRHHRESDLQRQATTDPVTGLPNRHALLVRAADRLRPGQTTGVVESPARDSHHPSDTPSSFASNPAEPAALFLDIDAFRRVNHSFGYSVGDATLHAVARRFSSVLESSDILGRWDGDEFVVLTGPSTAPTVADLAERLAAALDEPLEVHGHRIQLSVSVGVARAQTTTSTSRFSPSAAGAPARSARHVTTRGDDHALTQDARVLIARAGEEVTRTRARRRNRLDRADRTAP
ncbi:Diguanylate cyclase [Frankia sp. AiPs1]|uniref:diguanylate cyclase domain-containing protein n=1 Tax=Frankia sp. AiPa1 TaxID=573492 RepID=UPI00202B7738|nr:diguanylate cyclase [Frankia sp. AiPa1]MCL9759950.1 GGDEF domain-containing protein [Frankia sp. AiPa1]